jgi:ribosomal protein S8
MSFNFELADFISRFRLGSKRHYRSLFVRYNTLNLDILTLFYNNGVIRGFYCHQDGRIEVFLKYKLSQPVLRKIELITRPGARQRWSLAYMSKRYNLTNFSGFYVVSTSSGIYTSQECMIKRISGEVLFKVII